MFRGDAMRRHTSLESPPAIRRDIAAQGQFKLKTNGPGYGRNPYTSEFLLGSSYLQYPVEDKDRQRKQASLEGCNCRTFNIPSYVSVGPSNPSPAMPRTRHLSLEASDRTSTQDKRRRARSLNKSRDLKRKTTFDMHEEVRKANNTFVLEEITDMYRITDICMSTLRAMMVNKTHRKYLHHMNNNAISREDFSLYDPGKRRNSTNNSEKLFREQLQSIQGRSNTVAEKKPPIPSKTTPDPSVAKRYATVHPQAMKMQQRLAKFDKRMAGYEIGKKDSATSSAAHSSKMAPMHLTERLFLMDEENKDQEDTVVTIRPTVSLLTAKEALHCKWLRLSKSQVEFLEQMMRDQGEDPGIHAHTDTTDYDVFTEIRQIRKKEKALTALEEEEDD